MSARRLDTMTTSNDSSNDARTERSDRTRATAVFADPVAYLATHGIQATVVVEWAVPTAA